MDVFIITSSKINRGKVIDISILGLVEYFESGERDYKILARKITEKISITNKHKEILKEFLLHAFENKNRIVKLGKFYDIKHAEKEIKRSTSLWQKTHSTH